MEIIPQLLVNSLITGSIYALASIGLALAFGLLRILNFAHGHILMMGAYLFLLFSVQWEMNLIVSALLTAIASVFLSILMLRVFVFPFLRFSTELPLITTLALATMLESLVAMLFGVQVRTLAFDAYSQSYEILGIFITPVQILIIVSALIVLLGAAFVIHFTAFGRKVRALSENSYAAEAIAIDSRRLTYIVFALATLFSVYAGIMIGYETNLQPTMGNTYTIKAFAAMILGGLGNIWGTLLGSYILGVVENLSIGLDLGDFSIPAGYKDAFAFMTILLVLLTKPSGLFGAKKRVN